MLEPNKLKGGWAKSEIIPPAHYPMAGYLARKNSSQGSLDPLYIRALVLDQEGPCICILLADLLLVSSGLATRLRKLVAKALKMPARHVIVAATHTHSGPLVESGPFHLSNTGPGARTRRFMHQLEQTFVQTAVAARNKAQPVKISYRRCSIQGLATDRNDRRKNRAQPFLMVRLEAKSSRALFGILSCHPTVLGAANLCYSGDLHGEIARRYERQFDVALVANGAAANISTRFMRRNQTRSQISGFASSVIQQAEHTPFRACSTGISIASQTVKLPVKDFRIYQSSSHPSLTGRLADVAREGNLVSAQLSHMSEFRRQHVSMPVTLLRLGPLSFAAFPLELYAETGKFLWAKAKTTALCYANGYWGYVYIPGASRADYEVISSPFTAAADKLLRETTVKLACKA